MDIKIDNDRDLVIEKNDLALVTETDAVSQYLGQRLRTFLTEWFLDEQIGLPYFDEFFVKNPNSKVIQAILQDKILTSPGVIALYKLDATLDKPTRELSIDVGAQAKGGVIEFQLEVGGL